MQCIVFQLKRHGVTLDREAVKASGVQGDLWFTQKRPGGMPAVEATLYGANGATIIRLSCAEVRRITSKGVLIRGHDGTDSQWEVVPQVWWCELLPGAGHELDPRAIPGSVVAEAPAKGAGDLGHA